MTALFFILVFVNVVKYAFMIFLKYCTALITQMGPVVRKSEAMMSTIQFKAKFKARNAMECKCYMAYPCPIGDITTISNPY